MTPLCSALEASGNPAVFYAGTFNGLNVMTLRRAGSGASSSCVGSDRMPGTSFASVGGEEVRRIKNVRGQSLVALFVWINTLHLRCPQWLLTYIEKDRRPGIQPEIGAILVPPPTIGSEQSRRKEPTITFHTDRFTENIEKLAKQRGETLRGSAHKQPVKLLVARWRPTGWMATTVVRS